jgi:hypothetical protein
MKSLRNGVTLALAVLLCGGYAASQLAYFNGTWPDYYAKIDSKPISMLALALLLSAVALAFVKERDEESS